MQYLKRFSGIVVSALLLVGTSCAYAQTIDSATPGEMTLSRVAAGFLRKQIIKEAAWALKQAPLTVTASVSPRSAGGQHDFYSEGDYWWPDPAHPDGPYIQRDGLSNPDNFTVHRLAMIRFSKIIGALASAYKLSGDCKYVEKAVLHLNAWFINPLTRMNPNLQYAQAIKGLFTGRGIGIIDTIHLMDVAQGTLTMEKQMRPQDLEAIKSWFSEYLQWLMSHPNGIAEMNAKNNHGTCFVAQVASFAKLTANQQLLDFCSERYKNVLLPKQMAADGSFPLELARTKPYGYSLFNLDVMAVLCQTLSGPGSDLWNYETPDGKSIKKGIQYLYPFIADKNKWPLKPDVMYWQNWPVAQPSLLFAAVAFDQQDWFNTWKKLEHHPKEEEVLRNLPVKYPLIWIN
jgi:hypothetical protein